MSKAVRFLLRLLPQVLYIWFKKRQLVKRRRQEKDGTANGPAPLPNIKPRRTSLVSKAWVWALMAIILAPGLVLGAKKLSFSLLPSAGMMKGAFYWLAIALIAAAIAGIGYLVYKKEWYPSSTTMNATMKKIPVGGLFRFAVGAALVFFVLFLLPGLAIRADKWLRGEGETAVAVTDAWTAPIRIPLGKMARYEPRLNAAFQVKLPSGHIYTMPRDPVPDKRTVCERWRDKWIDESASSFQLRLADPEVKTTVFDLSMEPFRLPCGETAPTATSSSVPAPQIPKLFPDLRLRK